MNSGTVVVAFGTSWYAQTIYGMTFCHSLGVCRIAWCNAFFKLAFQCSTTPEASGCDGKLNLDEQLNLASNSCVKRFTKLLALSLVMTIRMPTCMTKSSRESQTDLASNFSRGYTADQLVQIIKYAQTIPVPFR